MPITVHDALRIGGLQHSRLVAGENGLDRIVGCVDILEVPDGSLWLRENELLVTTCYAVRNDPEGQLAILRAMARSGAAALAVKFGRFIGQPPPQMIKLANELSIPLLDVPDGVSFMDITHPVMTAIVNLQADQLAYSEKIHRRLTSIALEKEGVDDVACELAQLLTKTIVVLNDSCEPIALSEEHLTGALAGACCLLEHLPDEIVLTIQALPSSKLVEAGGITWQVFPIDVQNRCYGYILVALTDGLAGALSDMQKIAVDHAVTAVALQLVREEAVREARRSYKRDFLEDLIAGTVGNHEMAIMRGESMDLHLDRPYAILLSDVDGFAQVLSTAKESHEAEAVKLKRQLLRIAEYCVASWPHKAMVVSRSDNIVIVLPLGRKLDNRELRKRLSALAKEMQEQVRRRWPEMTITISISRSASDPLDFSERYHHARKMIGLARRMYGKGRIVFWEDVEIYGLLSDMGKPLEQFYESILGAIDRPGVKNRQELLETLSVYLECQGNVVDAADRLFIHRNTLRYRLERLREVLGRGWDEPDDRFTLLMALKIRNLLDRQQVRIQK